MTKDEKVTGECVKQIKIGKILHCVSQILVPGGLISLMLVYAFCSTAALILIPGSIALAGFVIGGVGETMRDMARDKLNDYYRERMLRADAALLAEKW